VILPSPFSYSSFSSLLKRANISEKGIKETASRRTTYSARENLSHFLNSAICYFHSKGIWDEKCCRCECISFFMLLQQIPISMTSFLLSVNAGLLNGFVGRTGIISVHPLQRNLLNSINLILLKRMYTYLQLMTSLRYSEY